MSRGDERTAPGADEVPQLERLRALLASFGAGGCDELYVALGRRVVPAPEDSSTTFYLPEWYNALDATVNAALGFAGERSGLAGVVLQTVDSQDLGDVGVARLLHAADHGGDRMARVTVHGHWAQPVYVGSGLLGDVTDLIARSGGPIRFLGDHADDVVSVDCSDLA